MSNVIAITIRASGSNTNGVWVVPRSLPVSLGIELSQVSDLSDFASLIKENGTPVTTAPASGSQVSVSEVRLRRFHRVEPGTENEAKPSYSSIPSFALELIVAE